MDNLFKLLNKSIWAQMLIVIVLFLIVLSIFRNLKSRFKQEGFSQDKPFILKNGQDVYDKFYTSIYDELVYSPTKNEYEINKIIQTTKATTTQSIFLDIGSGTGHHVGELNNRGYRAIGIDKSSDMVSVATRNYPNSEFQNKNVLISQIFLPNSFTHITCMYFTIYEIQNKPLFFKNTFMWLKPGGYIIIHVVDRDKFDPILPPGNPILFDSIQKYSNQRITTTNIKFTDFSYSADFKPAQNKNDNKCEFVEKFRSTNNDSVRKNEHILYMDNLKSIVHMAQQTGFLINGKIDLIECQYDYQYLYIFQKPKSN